MSYLLHSSSYTAAMAAAERDSPARDPVDGPVNVVLRKVRSLLHGEPSQVAHTTNTMGDGSSGSSKRTERRRSASSASRHEVPPPSVQDHARAARAPEMPGLIEQRGGFAGSAGDASPRPAPTSVAPPATNQSHVHSPQSARPVDAATDASLYTRAVDYTDLEEILRCPLPSVPDCPTPCAFGRHSVRLNGDESVTAASTLSAPPQTSSALQPPLTFRCIAADSDTGISVFSTPVEDCPMHLMRAYAVLPCSPREVLQYMGNDIRPRWDSYLRRSALLRELTPPEQTKAVERQYPLSSSIGTAGTAVVQRSPTSLSAQSRGALHQPASSSPCTTDGTGGCGGRTAALGPATAAHSSSAAFEYLPGQRRVAIHYLETRSPVPFVQDRDFEIVVAEEVRSDDTAYMKAFSTPLGYHMPLGPRQTRYVRAVVLLSGMVARPLDAATVEEVLPPVLLRHRQAAAQHISKELAGIAKKNPSASTTVPGDAAGAAALRQYCVVEYVGLVHPMGLLPGVLVNMIISAQLNGMRKMQAFITLHPMSTLRPRSVAHAAMGDTTDHPLQELLASLQSPLSSPRKGRSVERSQESGAVQRAAKVNPEPSSVPSSPALLTASRASSWWRRQMHRLASNL